MDNKEELNVSTKNRFTALMLCWFLGFFGVHRLYAGKLGSGFLMIYGTIVSTLVLIVCAPIGYMCFITMLALVANDFAVKDCYGKQMSSDDLYR